MRTDADDDPRARPAAWPVPWIAAPFALMALIWWLSAQPGAGPGPTVDLVNFLERKLAHVVLFGALWTAWWLAFRRRGVLVAAALAVGYGVVDEAHQRHVIGRTGTPRDVAIDAVGVALAIVVARGAASRSAL